MFNSGISKAESEPSRGLFLDLALFGDKTAPDLFVPLRWGNNLYSGFGYRLSSVRIKESNSLPSSLYTSNENNYLISEDRFKLNVLTYEGSIGSSKYSLGIDYDVINIVEEEYGYLEPLAQPHVAFKNVNSFDTNKLSFNVAYESKLSSNISYKVSYVLAPEQDLNYSHDIYYITGSFIEGNHSGTYKQGVSQKLGIDLEFKVSSLFDISFGYSQDILPVKFEYNNFNGSGYDLTALEYDKETQTTSLKLLFKKELFGGVRPTVGIKKEVVIKGPETISDENVFVIGVENRF